MGLRLHSRPRGSARDDRGPGAGNPVAAKYLLKDRDHVQVPVNTWEAGGGDPRTGRPKESPSLCSAWRPEPPGSTGTSKRISTSWKTRTAVAGGEGGNISGPTGAQGQAGLSASGVRGLEENRSLLPNHWNSWH